MCKVYSVLNHNRVDDSQEMIIIRGLPGSGKSTKGLMMVDNGEADELIEADQFFVEPDGTYNYDGDKIREAHNDCRQRTSQGLSDGKNIVVANTFVYRWQMQPYLDYCRENGINVKVICLYNSGLTPLQLHERCVHSVPLDTIQLWYDTYEVDWENADPTPPWMRNKES